MVEKAKAKAKRGPSRPRKDAVQPKTQKKRRRSWADEDDEDEDFGTPEAGDESGDTEQSTPDEKPKKRGSGRPRKNAAVEKDSKRGSRRPRKNAVAEKEEPAKHRKRQAAKVSPPYADDADDDDEPAARKALEEKHRMRKQQHELDSERLLDEVRDLAKAEKEVHQQLIEKLKNDVAALSALAEKEKASRKREVERQVAVRMREFESQQRKRDAADEEKTALRQHIKELEAQFASFKRNTGPDDVVMVSSGASATQSAGSNSEASLQLAQANKLLEIYRLVTSTDIRLIEALEDDGQEVDDCTDVVCTTTDSAAGKRFEFELSVPASASSEIEYLPSETPTTDIKVPSYLRDELTFKRSEMTKFMRTVLDVVIRTKKEHKAKDTAR